MRQLPLLRQQRGATLVVGLIMLVLITLLMTSAFMLSSTNAKSVGNMQSRNEAVSAANMAIEQVLSSPFTVSPSADSINVDLNNDGQVDYTVNFDVPTCISASEITSTSLPPSSITLSPGFTVATSNFYQTVWDLNATVVDPRPSGVSMQVRQGVSVLLTQVQYNAVCNP